VCGRYQLYTLPEAMATRLGVPSFPAIGPRYNISPTQTLPVVRLNSSGVREAVAMRWGLVPFWADDLKIVYTLINARSETVASKPAFRAAFKARRCLIPADGFYEWRTEGKLKTPFRFCLADDEPFAFAGLWECWSKGESPVETYTIITTTPNELVATLHDRMPAMLPPDAYDQWLDPKAKPDALTSLLAPFPAGLMTGFVVGREVGNVKHDKPSCIDPV